MAAGFVHRPDGKTTFSPAELFPSLKPEDSEASEEVGIEAFKALMGCPGAKEESEQ